MGKEMICDIQSFGFENKLCTKEPKGDCANCNIAHNYMSLFGPGSFAYKLERMDCKKNGRVLEYECKFDDGDPIIYVSSIRKGKYIHLKPKA